MKIEEEKQGSLVIVSPVGRVDGFGAPDLEKRFTEVVARGDSLVVMDCGQMDYISSAGLRAVLVGARKCQQGGGRFALCALQPACKSVMEISGFLTMFEAYETRADAVEAEAAASGAASC